MNNLISTAVNKMPLLNVSDDVVLSLLRGYRVIFSTILSLPLLPKYINMPKYNKLHSEETQSLAPVDKNTPTNIHTQLFCIKCIIQQLRCSMSAHITALG